jgi:hypothetical protein
LVRLPAALTWPLAVAAAVAVGALGWRALRTGAATGRRLAAGAGAALVPLVLGPLATSGLWALLVTLRPGYAGMLDPWRPTPYRLALLALVAAILLAWYALLRRRIGAAAVTFGALGWLAVLGLALAALAPGGSYLAALPALAGGIAGAAAPRAGLARSTVITVGSAVAVVVLAPTVLLFFPALGLASGAGSAFLATLLGLALLPAIDPLLPRGGLVGAAPVAGCLLIAVALVVTGLVVNRFDAVQPAPAQLMYVLDADTGRARWLSTEQDPGRWTSQFVHGQEPTDDLVPVLDGELAAGPAPAAPLPAPDVTLQASRGGPPAPERTVTVMLRPQRPVRLMGFRVDGDRVLRATVAGRELDPARVGPPFGAIVHAPPPDGVRVTLVLAGTGEARLRVIDGSDGLARTYPLV